MPAPSLYVDTELSNGKVMLGGADAAQAAAKSEVALREADEPADDDPAPDAEDQLFPNEAGVYALLREEKNRIARELDTAAYHVAQNRALMAMARCAPT